MSDVGVVLDASAVLALLQDEAGSEGIAALMVDATISSINLSEVVAKLAEHGLPESAIRDVLDDLALDVTDFDAETAVAAGLLRPATRSLGLSLGDRACLALGMRLQRRVITTERRWSEINLGVPITVAR